jgi:DeoR/GlpR family transcriptional regulator of sugar metabolism
VRLVELPGVTEPAIRKDLSDLHNRRLLRRPHGGAIAIVSHLERILNDRSELHRGPTRPESADRISSS